MISTAREKLRDVFGFDEFRPMQADIIENVLSKKDTLVVMPTGGGKSLCYQLPALMFEGVTIVVSPLISLMKDQVDQLSALGVPVCMLNSSLTAAAYRENVEKILQNRVRLLYIAPESLMKPNVANLLASVRVDCMAIDEAHCISFWGHEFRPEYRQLTDIRQRFPHAVCVALTATATPRVQRDIGDCLGFSRQNAFVANFDRKNLLLEVEMKGDAWGQVLEFIGKFPDESGIIYCFTRKQVDALSQSLVSEGYSAAAYHAGMTDDERGQNQEKFIRDDVKIIVATIAFGMGIDKPDIRFVLHFDLPKNLEHYYQEIGRAGRDGLPAHCRLLFGYGDTAKVRGIIDKMQDEQEKRVAGIQLTQMLGYAETRECRRIPLLSHFGDSYDLENCGMCDNCRGEKTPVEDITMPAQKFLSCVKRTGERFGAVHIIDVLRGSKAKKVLKFRHEQLSTYGIGVDISKRQWHSLSHQFLHKGYLAQDVEHGNLRLTEKGWDVLRGKEKAFGYLEAEKRETAVQAPHPVDYDKDLFQRLRALRKARADAENVPPYAIFPDKTLIQMASYFPQGPESLARIHGVGKVKLATFGPAFLDEIQAYCDEHQIEEAAPISRRPAASKMEKPVGKKRFEEVGEAFCGGKSIPELMSLYDVKDLTIINHLYAYLKEGNRIDPARFEGVSEAPEQDQQSVMASFDKLGESRLRPVFDDHDGRIGFDDLHRIRLRYLSLNTPEQP